MTVNDLTGTATVLAGEAGLSREILSPQMSSPELSALAAWRGPSASVLHVRPGQLKYLCSLPRADQRTLIRALMKLEPACIMVSGGEVCSELLAQAEASKIPLMKSRSTLNVGRMLVEKLSPKTSLHGVLVQIFGLGVLIIGESAVGKSEAALDLVLRGHRLIADDMVLLDKTRDGIQGRAAELGADLLQIRGLGIINVRALYGESATGSGCAVGLVVELEEWRTGHHYSLVGLRERRYRLLGINLPYLKLPVKPGRNMATLIEVAARNQILKHRGVFTARDLGKRLQKRLNG